MLTDQGKSILKNYNFRIHRVGLGNMFAFVQKKILLLKGSFGEQSPYDIQTSELPVINSCLYVGTSN